MSCIIYWFSGTGNSRAVAEQLAEQIDDAFLAWMGRIDASGAEADRVGFVFPVYCFGLPNVVRAAVRSVPIRDGAYIFSVATMGSMPGSCHSQLRQLLEERGERLAAGWSIRMPSNYTPLGPPPSEEKRQRLFSAARERSRDIAAAVTARQDAAFEESAAPLRWLSKALGPSMQRRIPGSDRKFFAEDECSACGTCERVCPVGNITMDDSGPVWLGHCEQCFACLQWCPVNAIQFGQSTSKRERYHHPDYQADDFFLRPGTDFGEGKSETTPPESTADKPASGQDT